MVALSAITLFHWETQLIRSVLRSLFLAHVFQFYSTRTRRPFYSPRLDFHFRLILPNRIRSRPVLTCQQMAEWPGRCAQVSGRVPQSGLLCPSVRRWPGQWMNLFFQTFGSFFFPSSCSIEKAVDGTTAVVRTRTGGLAGPLV